MTQTMTVIYVEHTGHVVAAATQTAAVGEASPEEALAQAVGDSFPLRNLQVTGGAPEHLVLSLPAAALAAKSIAVDPAVLARPQGHVVDGNLIAAIPASAVILPTIDQSSITISTPAGAAAPADMKVLAVVDGPTPGGSVLRVQSGTILAGDTSVELNLSILPDEPAATIPGGASYAICVAIEGVPLTYGTQNIP